MLAYSFSLLKEETFIQKYPNASKRNLVNTEKKRYSPYKFETNTDSKPCYYIYRYCITGYFSDYLI